MFHDLIASIPVSCSPSIAMFLIQVSAAWYTIVFQRAALPLFFDSERPTVFTETWKWCEDSWSMLSNEITHSVPGIRNLDHLLNWSTWNLKQPLKSASFKLNQVTKSHHEGMILFEDTEHLTTCNNQKTSIITVSLAEYFCNKLPVGPTRLYTAPHKLVPPKRDQHGV